MARGRVIGLTQEDRDKVNQIGREVAGAPRDSGGRGPDLDDYPRSCPTYVVLTPLFGIDPITTESGTGSTIGGDTGTGYDVAYLPASAECEVYRLVAVPPRNVDELVEAGFSITVYSLSRIGHEGSVFVTAHRDMYGTYWIAEPGWPFGSC